MQISESAKTAKDTVLKAVGKRANVVITDAIEGDNALYNPDEDVIYISNGALDGSFFNNEDVARAVALHEASHKAEGTAAYTAMLDELETIIRDENAPDEIKNLVGDARSLIPVLKENEAGEIEVVYDDTGRRAEIKKDYWSEDLSKDQNDYVVNTELIGNLIGDLLGNSYFVERMGARNDSAWKRFIAALKVADMGKAAGISKEAQKYLSGLYKSYVKAVDDARQGVKISTMASDEEKEKAAEGAVDEKDRSNERASIRKAFFAELDEWEKEGMPSDEFFILGMTSEILQGLGAVESDIYMLGDKIKHILSDHPEMTLDEIKKIPQILENPVLVLKSRGIKQGRSQNTRLVVFGTTKATDGKPILSVLDLRPKENDLVLDDMQKVSSAYTKDNTPVDFVRNSEVLYVKEKAAVRLLRTIGFQVPIELQQNGYIGSISYFGQSVNIKGEKFSDVFLENTPNNTANERSSKQGGYRKKDASAVIYHILSKHLRVGDSYSKLLGATAKEAEQKLYDALNKAEGEERNAVAFEIADYLIDNAVIKTFESNPSAKANSETIAKFDAYLHKIDLEGIKGEIKKHFGNDPSLYGLWGKHKGKESVTIETVKAELSEKGIAINATEPAEILFEIHNARKAASKALEATGYTLVKNSLGEEEKKTARQEIAEEILNAFDKKEKASKVSAANTEGFG